MTTRDNLGADGDAFYDALISSHKGLSEPDSHAMNVRLVLLMANEIGDLETLRSLLLTARANPQS